LRAVSRCIPDRIAASPIFPRFVFSSISRFTCASVTATGISIESPFFYRLTRAGGFVYGLSVADAIIRSGQAKTLLLIGAEIHSSFMPWHPTVPVNVSETANNLR
jgi:hypothetical protein